MAAASACHHQLLATDSVRRQLKPPVYPSITRYELDPHYFQSPLVHSRKPLSCKRADDYGISLAEAALWPPLARGTRDCALQGELQLNLLFKPRLCHVNG
jgi:hypothetical protein